MRLLGGGGLNVGRCYNPPPRQKDLVTVPLSCLLRFGICVAHGRGNREHGFVRIRFLAPQLKVERNATHFF